MKNIHNIVEDLSSLKLFHQPLHFSIFHELRNDPLSKCAFFGLSFLFNVFWSLKQCQTSVCQPSLREGSLALCGNDSMHFANYFEIFFVHLYSKYIAVDSAVMLVLAIGVKLDSYTLKLYTGFWHSVLLPPFQWFLPAATKVIFELCQ